MTRLVVATTNPHKLREIRELLAEADVEVEALDALAGAGETKAAAAD